MDAIDHTVTSQPTDIVTSLLLPVGAYYGQNLSTTATLFGRSAVSMPSTSDPAFKFESGSEFEFVVSTGDKIWMWTDDPLGCQLILNELPA